MNEVPAPVNSIAPLQNVALFTELVNRLVNRAPALPGFGAFSGKAGYGKTFAAIYAINTFRAHYVECDFTWTQKAFCDAILVEIGRLTPRTRYKGPIYQAVAEIGDYMADNPKRPLIIDEADFLIKKNMIEIVRAIYKHCADAGASIILIGEENMPRALKMWERVDSRVLKSVAARPISTQDVATLVKLVAKGITMDEPTIERIRKLSQGSARRTVTRLYDIHEIARINGVESITEGQWVEMGIA